MHFVITHIYNIDKWTVLNAYKTFKMPVQHVSAHYVLSSGSVITVMKHIVQHIKCNIHVHRSYAATLGVLILMLPCIQSSFRVCRNGLAPSVDAVLRVVAVC